jgi:hypothetical protein
LRYTLMRSVVNGVERTSRMTFNAARWGIDRLERREEHKRERARALSTNEGLLEAPVDETERGP